MESKRGFFAAQIWTYQYDQVTKNRFETKSSTSPAPQTRKKDKSEG